MLTLSREALVKIKKDAWQVDSLSLLCFGYLLGSNHQPDASVIKSSVRTGTDESSWEEF